MAQMDALLGVLELLAASQRPIDSRIRLQKEAYLIAVKLAGLFKESRFEYHHYGPYSRELSDATQLAALTGLVIETRESPDDGSYTRYSYAITEGGKQYLKEASAEPERISSLVEAMEKVHWRALELAATIKFLEVREGYSDRETATQEALRLKPATSKFLADAKLVLSDLSI